MFAVIYRSFIKPGHEERYQDNWKKIASYFVKKRGALGSSLHKTKEGLWVAYSRWPDEATRAASWPSGDDVANPDLPSDICEAIKNLKDCLENQLPEICMEVQEEVFCLN